jgi:hypothetical protein
MLLPVVEKEELALLPGRSNSPRSMTSKPLMPQKYQLAGIPSVVAYSAAGEGRIR